MIRAMGAAAPVAPRNGACVRERVCVAVFTWMESLFMATGLPDVTHCTSGALIVTSTLGVADCASDMVHGGCGGVCGET